MKIILEMRPALDGHAGIPQETRLLFRGLGLIDGFTVDGLVQSSGKVLAKGLPAGSGALQAAISKNQQINRLSRVVVSLQHHPSHKWYARATTESVDFIVPVKMVMRHLVGAKQQLTRFDATHYKDFIWRNLFSKTLPYEDFDNVTKSGFRILQAPWTTMHVCALAARRVGLSLYPRIDTNDFDLMIAQTPFPGSVTGKTKMVVRYHDAIPVLMPHTISDKAFHQASHYRALEHNVACGAYFSCVSEATRQDLISIFPEAESRSITIHNMVSHHYFPEESSATRVAEVIRTRLHTMVAIKSAVKVDTRAASANSKPIDYLLMVSTLEPRKNHLALLSAWEQLRVEKFPNLKLITVGMLGWDHDLILKKFRPWQERGELFMLEDVPSPELRLLYKHARATVCPSFGEGFDFSGVESMRSGGVVAASDIGVHREVYGEAAEYFSPYSTAEMVAAIGTLVDAQNSARRLALIEKGAEVSSRYLPEKILPKWREFLTGLCK